MVEPDLVPKDFVFVDLETTGANAARDRITEVGVVRVSNGQLVEEWSSLVNPGCRIPPYIENFTGITNAMVADAPRFADLAPLILDKLRAAAATPDPAAVAETLPEPIFVAHNARFDYGFLRAEFRRAGMVFGASVLCTVKLSRRLFPEFARHNLDVLMERHGVACAARHRALGDARVLFDLWRVWTRDVAPSVLAGTVRAMLSTPTLPPQLPQELIGELPDGPGAYRFFGADDALLYVGRAHGLRAAILAHFESNASARDARLTREVTRIDWAESGGALGAWLQESSWLKERTPSINRRARPNRPATLTVGAGHGEFAVRSVDEVVSADADGLERCFGLFQSERDARKAVSDIAMAHRLCLKALGLEQGPGSCLAYQIGQCKGACAGKEPVALHDLRARMALVALRVKSWPFPGRMALRESASFAGECEWHVFDNWCYVGTAHAEDELEHLAGARSCGAFDVELYRMLLRYLAKHPDLQWRDLSQGTRWTTTSVTG